ncbi:MAG: CHAT domain-containing protein, partial [Flavitalea sp.]
GNPSYMDQLVGLHESGLYNRIRSRLDMSGEIQFARLPAAIQDSEKKLKKALSGILDSEGNQNDRMQRYLQAQDDWTRFLNKLSIEFPVYYTMRYASLFKTLQEIIPDIPEGTTVIRYMFIGKKLLALVADRQNRNLIELNGSGIDSDISSISEFEKDADRTGDILYRLYSRLWQPLEKQIRFKKLVIIPDGILYNVNFETLTPRKIKKFEELLFNTLLTEYSISYQYSLFLLKQRPEDLTLGKNFIAFTPGFSDQIKEDYRIHTDTAVEIDHFYLSLLPQPFTVNLAAKIADRFGGNVFSNEKSTVNAFKEQANGHRIIHIGTHAIADNVHPEFSKIVFSKEVSGNQTDNYLYLFDIYNCNLTADLTALTACESGKAGYKDGEGMISLAHAFQYAGSKSILMSLGKIDEKTSARLIGLFYENLATGMRKNDALRQAKLTYLKESQGRLLAPAYWAGLVLMGDTSPIQLTPSKKSTGLIIVSLLILCFASACYFFLSRKTAA